MTPAGWTVMYLFLAACWGFAYAGAVRDFTCTLREAFFSGLFWPLTIARQIVKGGVEWWHNG